MLTASPASAQAATCDDPAHPIATDLTFPRLVVVGIKKTKRMHLDVYTFEGCQVDGATATVDVPRHGKKKVTLTSLGGNGNGYVHWTGSLAIKPLSLKNADAGAWPVTYAVSGEESDQQTIAVRVYRASRLSFNAGPEPVRHGRLTFTGTLQRASWTSKRYVAWKGQQLWVAADLDASDDHDPDLIVRPTTRADGTFRVTRDYRGPGLYFVDASYSSTTAGVRSRLDRVDS